MNRVDVESAVIAMGDVAVCIKMVDDATEEGNAVQQGRAVQVLMDIFKARYAALVSCVQGDQSAAQGSFCGNNAQITHKRAISPLISNKKTHDKRRISSVTSWVLFISEWRDSNSRPPAPKAGALPTAQHPGGDT